MLEILQVETDEQKLGSRVMLREYLEWGIETFNREFDAHFDPEATLKEQLHEALREDSKFAPPEGRMLLAEVNGSPVGLICLRKIGADTAEVKRFYVKPALRGKGVGKALLERLCEEARQTGYTRIRLDSAPFMKAAHALYRSAGFRKIEPYPESDCPPEIYANWLFMELML